MCYAPGVSRHPFVCTLLSFALSSSHSFELLYFPVVRAILMIAEACLYPSPPLHFRYFVICFFFFSILSLSAPPYSVVAMQILTPVFLSWEGRSLFLVHFQNQMQVRFPQPQERSQHQQQHECHNPTEFCNQMSTAPRKLWQLALLISKKRLCLPRLHTG